MMLKLVFVLLVLVFVHPLAGQALTDYGITADAQGRSWFVLPEEGPYQFHCEAGDQEGSITMDAIRHRMDVQPGYTHIQHGQIDLTGPGDR